MSSEVFNSTQDLLNKHKHLTWNFDRWSPDGNGTVGFLDAAGKEVLAVDFVRKAPNAHGLVMCQINSRRGASEQEHMYFCGNPNDKSQRYYIDLFERFDNLVERINSVQRMQRAPGLMADRDTANTTRARTLAPAVA